MGLKSWLIHRLGGYTYEDVYGRNEMADDDYIDLTELSEIEKQAEFIASNIQADCKSILAIQNPMLPETELITTYHGQVILSPKDLRAACQAKHFL